MVQWLWCSGCGAVVVVQWLSLRLLLTLIKDPGSNLAFGNFNATFKHLSLERSPERKNKEKEAVTG